MYRGAGMLLYRTTDSGIEVLLGKRKYNPFQGPWTVPGGGIERHRSTGMLQEPLRAAIREVSEEIGVRTDIPDTETIPRTTLRIPGFFVFHTFIAPMPEGVTPQPLHEFHELKWFAVSELPKPLHIGVRSSIRKLRKRVAT